MMKLDAKLNRVTTLLLQKTREGKVQWKPSATDDVFVSSFGEYGVSIRKGHYSSFELSLMDKTGAVFESIFEAASEKSEYLRLEELFILARRSAYNIEESIDTLLQELESR